MFKTENNGVHDKMWQNNKPYGQTAHRLPQYILNTRKWLTSKLERVIKRVSKREKLFY